MFPESSHLFIFFIPGHILGPLKTFRTARARERQQISEPRLPLLFLLKFQDKLPFPLLLLLLKFRQKTRRWIQRVNPQRLWRRKLLRGSAKL